MLVTANPILAPSAGDVQPSGVGFLLPCVVRDSSRLRSCSVAVSRLGFYLVSPPSSRLGSGPRLVASSRVGLAGGSWGLVAAGWCLAGSLRMLGSARCRLAVVRGRLVGGSWGARGGSGRLAGVLRAPCGCSGRLAGCLAATRGDSQWLVGARDGSWRLGDASRSCGCSGRLAGCLAATCGDSRRLVGVLADARVDSQ